MDNKITGAFISERRKALSLSQKQLAEMLNVTDKAVSKWETGRSAPDIALLEPLAKELGVSVVEILQGEKIEEENFTAISDEVVVKTMKKDKKKLRNAVVITVGIIISIIALGFMHYYGYHYFHSVSADDIDAIEKRATEYVGTHHDGEGNMKIVKSLKKGTYYFYLLEGTNKGEKFMSLAIFRINDAFKERITFNSGSIGQYYKPNTIEQSCVGDWIDGNQITVNAFYGYDMTDTEYSYYYRGIKSVKTIENGIFLDAFIDINDSWSPPLLIYND